MSIASSRPFLLSARLMPMEEPRFEGFTYTGNESSFITRLSTPARLRFHSERSTHTSLSTGKPQALNMRFMAILSMPSAEPSTPEEV